MPCSVCLREKPVVSRGLCNACYQRWRKTGTTDYQRWGRKTVCNVGGCDKPAVSHGLCDTHRKRIERHKHMEETRPDDWGAKKTHPLFHSWAWMRRHRAHTALAPEWCDDFLQFVTDVGERPSPSHKLYAADETKPLGPQNYVWKRAITERAEGEDEQTYRNRMGRVYRAARAEAHKGYELKKLFGLSYEQYADLSAKQGHRCAVCGEPEEMHLAGRQASLAVDHCHKTGVIRGLLCARCNRGLGLFGDDTGRLRAAIEYLERHAPTETPSSEG